MKNFKKKTRKQYKKYNKHDAKIDIGKIMFLLDIFTLEL